MRSAIRCAACGTWRLKENSAIGRAKRGGFPMYCDRACAGIARRLAEPPSEAERKAAKRLYDAQRRVAKADEIRAKKREYHLRTYDPAKAAKERALKMDRHVEYCRRPEYREYKRVYDRQYRAKQDFGAFWEPALLLLDLEAEIAGRITRYEIYQQNGTLNKKLNRRRYYDKTIGC